MTTFTCSADTSAVTDFNYTWSGCSGLTALPEVDMSGGTTFNYTWQNCTNLVCIAGTIDMTNAATADFSYFNSPAITAPPDGSPVRNDISGIPGGTWTNPSSCP